MSTRASKKSVGHGQSWWCKATFTGFGGEGRQQIVVQLSSNMRAPQNQAERTDHAAISRSVKQSQRSELTVDGKPVGRWAERTHSNTAHVPEVVHVFEGNVSRQLDRCYSSDRDVPESKMDNFLTHCRTSDRMSSNGARLAETCETCDESPSLNLGGRKQGHAIPTAGTDVRSREIVV